MELRQPYEVRLHWKFLYEQHPLDCSVVTILAVAAHLCCVPVYMPCTLGCLETSGQQGRCLRALLLSRFQPRNNTNQPPPSHAQESVAAGREPGPELLAAYMAYIRVEEKQGDPARVQVRRRWGGLRWACCAGECWAGLHFMLSKCSFPLCTPPADPHLLGSSGWSLPVMRSTSRINRSPNCNSCSCRWCTSARWPLSR